MDRDSRFLRPQCDSYMLSAVPSAHSGSLLAENGGVEIGKRKFSQNSWHDKASKRETMTPDRLSSACLAGDDSWTETLEARHCKGNKLASAPPLPNTKHKNSDPMHW
ncbi:hypothetical protein F443_19960 [Phytophthora nicotianae P1569]|uniref:Uncharacterized protein n=1 Tax=Phytophthora nicotianae P1569 TaxID=1317065 RepID=V9E2K5_PHYNI|nr:hypothetical protein F443_19960 [Phytophthora nicotianae P1569]